MVCMYMTILYVVLIVVLFHLYLVCFMNMVE